MSKDDDDSEDEPPKKAPPRVSEHLSILSSHTVAISTAMQFFLHFKENILREMSWFIEKKYCFAARQELWSCQEEMIFRKFLAPCPWEYRLAVCEFS